MVANRNEVKYETDPTTARIDDARMEAVNTLFLQFQELTQQYQSPMYRCPGVNSFECDPIFFSACMKMELKEFSPALIAPSSE